MPHQKEVQLKEIVLVLNLEGDHEFNSLVNDIMELPFNNFKVFRTSGGLPSARNIGIRSLQNSEVIHFIDDDVRVGEGYFKHVESFLLHNLIVDGGAPIEINPTSSLTKAKLFKIKSVLGIIPVPGKVTTSMRNYWGPVIENSPIKVDWLPGLAMFYRKSSLDGHFFNEKLETFSLGGYGLGEDLMFTLNLTEQKRILFALPDLNIMHDQLPNAANQRQDIAYANGELRKELLRAFPDRFNSWLYVISVILDHVLQARKAPFRFHTHFRRCWTEIYSFLRN